MKLGKIWWNMGEREFSADSEYRIRFFIAFTVLELLDDLWTSFWPFWPKMTTLWMNISRTEQAFDVRFFSAGLYWSPLHSEKKWAKSFEKFLRKSQKNRYFDHFFVLYGWTKIFSKKPASSLFIIYQWLTPCQISERSLERLSGKILNQLLLPTDNSKSNLNWRWELLLRGWSYRTFSLRGSKISNFISH